MFSHNSKTFLKWANYKKESYMTWNILNNSDELMVLDLAFLFQNDRERRTMEIHEKCTFLSKRKNSQTIVHVIIFPIYNNSSWLVEKKREESKWTLTFHRSEWYWNSWYFVCHPVIQVEIYAKDRLDIKEWTSSNITVFQLTRCSIHSFDLFHEV